MTTPLLSSSTAGSFDSYIPNGSESTANSYEAPTGLENSASMIPTLFAKVMGEAQSKSTPTVSLSDGSKYHGELKDGKPHGRGNIAYPSSDPYGRASYDGDLENGEPHGQGFMKWTNGQTYLGSFEHGLQLKGKQVAPDGASFVGTFRAGKKYDGKEIFSKDGYYEGTFQNDQYWDGTLHSWNKEYSRWNVVTYTNGQSSEYSCCVIL